MPGMTFINQKGHRPGLLEGPVASPDVLEVEGPRVLVREVGRRAPEGLGTAALRQPIRRNFNLLITSMVGPNTCPGYLHFSEGKWNSIKEKSLKIS